MRAKWRITKTVAGRVWDPITRDPNPDVDLDHLAWIRTLPCAVRTQPLPRKTPCRYIVHAHHPVGAGMALKAPDRRAIPLCGWHHQDGGLHQFAGPFEGWSIEQIHRWEHAMSDLYEFLGELRRTRA